MSHICNYSFIMAFMALAQTVEASHKAPATLSSALVVKKFNTETYELTDTSLIEELRGFFPKLSVEEIWALHVDKCAWTFDQSQRGDSGGRPGTISHFYLGDFHSNIRRVLFRIADCDIVPVSVHDAAAQMRDRSDRNNAFTSNKARSSVKALAANEFLLSVCRNCFRDLILSGVWLERKIEHLSTKVAARPRIQDWCLELGGVEVIAISDGELDEGDEMEDNAENVQ